MQIPNNIKRGDVIKADWLNELLAYIKSITPVSSPTILVSTTSAGTSYRNISNAKPQPASPAIFDSTTATDWSSGSVIYLTGSSGLISASIPGGVQSIQSASYNGLTAVATNCVVPSGSAVMYYKSDGEYKLFGLPATPIISNETYSTASHCKQVQLKYIVGTTTSTLSSPIDIVQYIAGNAVVNWRVDTTSGEIQLCSQSFYTPEVGDVSSWYRVADTEESLKTSC